MRAGAGSSGLRVSMTIESTCMIRSMGRRCLLFSLSISLVTRTNILRPQTLPHATGGSTRPEMSVHHNSSVERGPKRHKVSFGICHLAWPSVQSHSKETNVCELRLRSTKLSRV